jgi:hypothetical protein
MAGRNPDASNSRVIGVGRRYEYEISVPVCPSLDSTKSDCTNVPVMLKLTLCVPSLTDSVPLLTPCGKLEVGSSANCTAVRSRCSVLPNPDQHR